LGRGGVVDDEHRVWAADERVRPLEQEPAQGRVIPGRAADEMLELVVTLQAEPPWAAGSKHSPGPSRPRR
jgi:hypothetical protein